MTRPSAPPAKPARQVPKPGPSVRENTKQPVKLEGVPPKKSKHADPERAKSAPVDHAPAIITGSRVGSIKIPAALTSQAYHDLCAEIDKVESDVGIETTSLVSTGFIPNAISSGCLMYDFVVGGGVAPGRFSIVPGVEGSGKSTLVNYLASTCVLQGIPIYWFDAEAALSPDYASKIFSKFGIRLADLMGQRDPKNNKKWIVPPVIRYTQDAIGEHVFKTMHHILKLLPTVKMGADGTWWKLVESKGKKGWVEDESNGKPQFLFIVDSWPALLPESIDENLDKSPMAVQARMFSDLIKTVKSYFAQKNVALFSVNQIRLNPAVRMGCVHAETKVTFVDGRVYTMRQVVNKKIKGKVWSYNETTNQLEPKEIKAWHINGKVETADEWITFRADAVNTINGFSSFTVTTDHEILTDSGWKPAKTVTKKDKMVTRNESIINGTLREFLAGASIGDLSLVSWGKQATLGLCNNEQPDYLQWRLEKLGKFFTFKEYEHGKYVKVSNDVEQGLRGKQVLDHKNYRSDSRRDLHLWKDLVGLRSARKIEPWFTPLSLAIWYMDDGSIETRAGNMHRGSISAKRFKNNQVELDYLSLLLSKFKITHTIKDQTGTFIIDVPGFKQLCKVICKYVPECMQYKLAPDFQGRYKDFELKAKVEHVSEFVEIKSIESGSAKKFRDRTKYDLTVEGNHNYMIGNPVNGVIVHNSPEYEPGGSALKFYSDCRTQIRRVSPNTAGVPSGAGAKYSSEKGLNGGEDQYVYAKIVNTKNKMFAPFRESVMRIRFLKDGSPGDGICETWDCASYLQATGQMVQRGNTMTMNVMPVKENGKNFEVFQPGQRISRDQFKQIVEGPEYKRSMYMHCLKQLRGGYGFELERAASKKLIASGAAKEGAEPVSIEA